ncbi:MAG: indole-3-glycerol phosphate synthase TrpC [Flavobacteriaceae bacterium]|nr:indole-3-glycerol phosphate synthase TrpC [Flavobacteriaceae bacterium]
MTILDLIVSDLYAELKFKKQLIPISQLEHSVLFERTSYSLSERIRNSSSGIITEHKRRSPSKPNINLNTSIHEVAQGYEKAGASGMSVLTNTKYFGGSLDDLTLARAATQLPLLRKEFIIDEYQILEAKAYGADAILLIAACLSRNEIKSFSETAQKLGLEVLLEVHNQEELDKAVMPSLNLIGVNNRNLKTFQVSLETSKHLVDQIPNEFVKISESGISDISAVKELKKVGFDGFLMGEHFMKTENPGLSAQQFIQQL